MTRVPTQSEIDQARANGAIGSDFDIQDQLIAGQKELAMTQIKDGGPATLWGVNIYGPDDMIAAPDYLTAIRMANTFNAWWLRLKTKEPLHEYDPHLWAVPVEWTGSSDSHADDLENENGEYQWLRIDAMLAAREVKP